MSAPAFAHLPGYQAEGAPTFHVHRGYRLAIPPERRRTLLSVLTVLFENVGHDGLVYASRTALAADLGASERAWANWERELTDLGILELAGRDGRRRVLRVLPPPPPSIHTYRTARPHPHHNQVREVSGHSGGGPLHQEKRLESAASGVSERSEKRGGGDGSPPVPPSEGARIYKRRLEAFFPSGDSVLLQRVVDLAEEHGARGTDAWVRECIKYARGKHRDERGPAPLLRKKLLSDEMPARLRDMPDPVQVTRTQAAKRVADRPGKKGCEYCGNGYGRIALEEGERPPPGAVFFMRNPITETDLYTCACCAHQAPNARGA